jgi:catechol 2,3-dioxygenase-like lactoylglutathione lyase family enzyme
MLLVSNLGRSVRFYRDHLGFAELDTGVGSAVLAYRGARVVLREVAKMSPVDRRVAHLQLEVPDVTAAHQRLKASGVQFEHRPRPSNRGRRFEQWSATLRDPDGHAVELIQWREREDLDAAVS